MYFLLKMGISIAMLDYQRVASIFLFPLYLHKNPKVTTFAPSFLFNVQSLKEYNKHPNKKAQCKCVISGSSQKKSLDLPSEKKYVMWFDWSWRYREAGKRDAGVRYWRFQEEEHERFHPCQVKWNASVEHLRSVDLLRFLIQHTVDGSEIRLTS